MSTLRTHSRKKVNGRVMVPFRAIAEVLGAEVTYDAGAITAKKGGETLSFALGGKQLTVTVSAGKTVKTVQLDTAPYKKADAPMFRCAFLPKRSALPCSGIRICRPPCCMTARRL